MSYLIAEIAGRKRWTQINIPADLVSFFGSAEANGYVDVIPVDLAGHTFQIERRKFSLKTSVNWTFGLSSRLASDADHPNISQPIAVFRRSGANYRYCVLMPNDTDYALLANHLSAVYTGPAKNRKRVLANQAQITAVFPSSPL